MIERLNPYEKETDEERSARIAAIKLNPNYDNVFSSSWALEASGRPAAAEAILLEAGLKPPASRTGYLSVEDQRAVAANTVAVTLRATIERGVGRLTDDEFVAAAELGAGLLESHRDVLSEGNREALGDLANLLPGRRESDRRR